MRLVDLPLSSIVSGPNVRSARPQDDTLDDELACSLEAVGVLQPVRVRRKAPDEYELLVGSRRYAAACMAQLQTIPAIVDEREPDPLRDAIEQITENVQREDLPPLDLARALRMVLDADAERFVAASRRGQRTERLSPAGLSRRLGKGSTWVGGMLKLLRLVPEVQGMIRDGAITASHGRALADKHPIDQVRLAREAARGAPSGDILALRSRKPHSFEVPGEGGVVRVAVGQRGLCDLVVGEGRVSFYPRQMRKVARAIGAIATAVEANDG